MELDGEKIREEVAKNLADEDRIAEAHIEINNPHVAVRMRRTGVDEFTAAEVMEDAREIVRVADRVSDFKAFKPRLSSDEVHSGAYLEFNNIDGDTNQVSDEIKASLADLGYTLVDKRFPI